MLQTNSLRSRFLFLLSAALFGIITVSFAPDAHGSTTSYVQNLVNTTGSGRGNAKYFLSGDGTFGIHAFFFQQQNGPCGITPSDIGYAFYLGGQLSNYFYAQQCDGVWFGDGQYHWTMYNFVGNSPCGGFRGPCGTLSLGDWAANNFFIQGGGGGAYLDPQGNVTPALVLQDDTTLPPDPRGLPITVTHADTLVLEDSTTVWSGGTGFIFGTPGPYALSPSTTAYTTANPFSISRIHIGTNNDFSLNNGDGLGNLTAFIDDSNGNPITSSTNTCYLEGGCNGADLLFPFGTIVPANFNLRFVALDGIQGEANFNISNIGFYREEPHPAISSLGQFSAEGIVAVPEGGTNGGNSIVFKGTLQSASAHPLVLQVEVEPFETPFLNIFSRASEPTMAGQIAPVLLPGLSPGQYHWQARAVDMSTLIASPWQEFGTAGNIDFVLSSEPQTAQILSQPSSLSFSYRAGTTVPLQIKDIVITGSPVMPISISALSDGNWLSTTPNSGTIPLTIHVSISSGLSRGSYAGQIVVMSATGAQLTIPVNITVTPTISFTLIFAQTADGPPVSSTHTATHFRDLISQLRIYHLDNSYGLANVSVLPEVDQNISWNTVGILSKYLGNEELFVNDAMKAAGFSLATLQTDGVIVVHNGPASQTTDGLNTFCKLGETRLCTETSFFSGTQTLWIVVSEDDLVGAWAHEVGHDLGTVRSIWTSSQPPTMLPHPTLSSVGCWDLMALGGWGSGSSSCNADAVPPVPTYMSSLSRATLGFIEYNRVTKEDAFGEHTINSLETADRLQKALNIQLDQTDCYVAEVRNNNNLLSLWDISVPTSGLVLYHIATDGNSNCGELTLAADGSSAETVNVRTILKAPGLLSRSQFKDYANGLTLQTLSDGLNNGQYSMQFAISHLNNESPTGLFGVVVSGGTLFKKVSSFFTGIPPASPVQLPDLDLHAYTDDGRHVGLNYATGEFENQISSDASGDQFNGQEWIVMPANTEGVHFVVSGFKTLQFLQQFPNFQSVVGQVDQASIAAIAIAPGMDESVPPSTAQTISIGGWTEIPLNKVTAPDGSISVSVGSPKPTIDSLIAELSAYTNANAFKNPGVGNALVAKLRAAKKAMTRNERQAALGQLTAFENQIRADNLISVKMIETQLLTDTDAVINDLR